MGSVACMGLGLMGSAFARCFIRHGHDVTVWNRDPEKCKPFEGQAAIATSPAEALAASDITTICVADYAAADSFLHTDEVAAAAKNTLLCQFTSGSAPDAREGQTWARDHGLDYLDCCVLGYPAEVDADQGWFFFAGPKPLFERHADVFNTMSGSVTFVGEPVGSASALDSALLESYYMAMIGVYHAASICASEGMDLKYYFDAFTDLAPLIGISSELARKQIAAGDYSGTDATLDVHVAAQEHIVSVAEANGIDTTVPRFVIDRCRKAVAAGYGPKEISAVFETFRKTS
jgi:3-hydroxyisobutyrate dehydrogenase-like beta-hydroxyacid dehydrogenase